MRKAQINALFRAYVRDHLSPTTEERDLVSQVYESIQDVLGEANCLQIGSYPRFTAVTPLHDLDVLYILGAWEPAAHDPTVALDELQATLEADYENPTDYRVQISRQTHSITLKFLDGADELFAVDVVPAYISGRNEFGGDMYVVPEIAGQARLERRRTVDEVTRGARQMTWIRSDPRGYISVATALNRQNDDFRKSVKLVKGWRASCKEADEDFPLKSFHLEQAVTRQFQRRPDIEIFDAVFEFFCELPDLVERSQIPDRADTQRNIDAYVDGLDRMERAHVRQARDFFLIKLEEIAEGADIGDLLQAGRHERASVTEAYLFDSRIPVLTEADFRIVGTVLQRTGGFRQFVLDVLGRIDVDRRIEFRLGNNVPLADLFKWKVKNDGNSAQPRGEITDHQTMNDPEHTKYRGQHFVECFAIRNGVCIGRSRQNVVLQFAG
ncbi:MAG: hypothetical protein ABL956_13575 [Hyphomonadaceae bacterium]